MTFALFVLCFVSLNCFVCSNDAAVLPNTTRQPRRYVKDFVFPDALPMRTNKPVVENVTTANATTTTDEPIKQQARVALDNDNNNNNNRTNELPAESTSVKPPKTCADYEREQILQSGRLLLTRVNAAPITENSVDYVRSIIANELDLFDVEYKILQAKMMANNELLFEMATPQEALEVVQQYCKLLKDTMWSGYLKAFQISETARNFSD